MHRRRLHWLAVLLLANALALVSSARAAGTDAPSPTRSIFVIEHVTVVPMTEAGGVRRNATVVIDDGRIASIDGPVPAGARRIDGRGKWLIPGLADMHVHMPSDGLPRPKKYPTEAPTIFFDTQDIMTPYIANGVTQVLNMDAVAASVGQRNEIARGAVIGPHIALAAVINGGLGKNGRIANTPADGRQAVRDAAAEGYDFIKVYSGLNVETFLAIVDEANARKLKTLGHVPDAFQGKLETAFVPGFAMVAHAEEFSKHSKEFSDEDAARFAQLARSSGAWLSPTLTVMRWIASQTRSLDELRASPTLQYVHPMLRTRWLTANRYAKNGTPESSAYFDRMVEFHRRLVKAFRAAGVPMVAGSDTLASGVVAGFSLHDELELLVDAGLTNEEALAAATRLPAVWLGVDSDRGTVEAGKRADLVLLDADPLLDIRHTRRIAGVFVGGRWVDRAQLDAMLADLARRYAEGAAPAK
jgi:imidazolonepropionase-like amidohydrolase